MARRKVNGPCSLRKADLLKLLDCVVELQQHVDPAILPRRMMEAMHRLVPTDGAGYSSVDLETGAASNESTFGQSPEILAVLQRNMSQHPLITHLKTHVERRARAISEFVTPDHFKSLAIYDELYRPMRVQDQIAVAIKSGSSAQLGLTASRDSWGFSSREKLLFTLLRPHILYCYENAQRLNALQEEIDRWRITFEQLPLGLAARERSGRWPWITRAALAMIQRYLPEARFEGGKMPAVIEQWAAAQIGRRDRMAGVPQPLIVSTSRGRLSLQFLTLPDGSHLVKFQETSPETITSALCHAGLTFREAEVIYWVLEGKSNSEIASLLNVSPRTIHKHLEHVFIKWHVATRTRAAKQAREILGNQLPANTM